MYETFYSIVSHLLVNETNKYENNGTGNQNRKNLSVIYNYNAI